MLKNLKNKKKKGFTLIELIIVIAIIAILAAVAIPKFGEVRKNANVKSDIANAKTIANAATALIAEGKINAPTGTTNKVLTLDNTQAADETNADKKDADEIEKYLQNVPTPKSNNATNFTVEIDKNGGVTVKAGSTPFFPASATDIK